MESNYLNISGKYSQKKPIKPKPHRLEKLDTKQSSSSSSSSSNSNSSFSYSNSSSSSSSSSSSFMNQYQPGQIKNEIIKNLEKDLEIINKKYIEIINENRNITSPLTLTSTIITNSRASSSATSSSITSSSSIGQIEDETIIKIRLYDQLLNNLTLLDREVLRKTSEGIPRLARRNSKPDSLGNDLNHLPAHLTIIDRLLDFHTQLKRETPTTIISTQNQIIVETNLEKNLKQENTSLKKQLESIESTFQEKLVEIERNRQSLQTQLMQHMDRNHQCEQNFQEKIKELNHEKHEYEKTINHLLQEKKDLEDKIQQLQQSQSKSQSQQSQSHSDDGQYSEEATREIFLLTKEVKSLTEKNLLLSNNTNKLQSIIFESINLLKNESNERNSPSKLKSNQNNQSNKEIEPESLLPIVHEFLSKHHTLYSTHNQSIQNYQETLDHHTQYLHSIQTSHRQELDRLKSEVNSLNEMNQNQKNEILEITKIKNSLLDSIQQNLNEYNIKFNTLQFQNDDLNKQLRWYQQVERTLSTQIQEFHSSYLDVDEQRKHLEYVISVMREEECRAQDLIDDLKFRLTELSKSTGKGINSQGHIV